MSQKQLCMYAAICGAVVFVGCLLPWISITTPMGSMSDNAFGAGFDLGALVFILGGAGGFLAGLTWLGRTKMVPIPQKTQLLAAAGCFLVALIFIFVNFMKDLGPSAPLAEMVGFGASRGIGLWLCLLAGIGAAVSMFLVLRKAGWLPKPGSAGGGDSTGD